MAAKQLKPGCRVASCHNEARSSMPEALCDGHYRQKERTGRTYTNWAKVQGPTCGICGRSVYEHGITEWCHVDQRIRYAAAQGT